ncbi:MAG: hypothetical protein QOE58_95 [Actinomycetota bacterium]|jgi:hypothetical protein|nr:hypothetical protein [Actinomycetota bacterium]
MDGTDGRDTGVGVDDESPMSARESLALIESQQEEVHRRLGVNVALFYGPWGAAYLLGFGSVFLTYPSALPLRLPDWVAAVIIGVLFPTAMVVTVAVGSRASRGLRGPSRKAAAMYGWSWTLGFGTLTAVNLGVTRLGLSADAGTLLWSGSSLLLVGVLYLAGGALWQDRFQYGLGVWMLVTGAASVLAGVPGNFAVVSLAGGGGLLLAAGYFLVRRPRRQVATQP